MLNDIIQVFQVTFLGPAASLSMAAMVTIMASEGEPGQGVEHTWRFLQQRYISTMVSFVLNFSSRETDSVGYLMH